MGVNQYKDVHTLWLEKTKQIEPNFESSPDMQRGIDNEPKILKLYCEQKNIEMVPIELVHPKFKFVRASLDGAHIPRKHFLEIKSPRKHNHEKTKKKNIIKPEYWMQMHHQYLATNFDSCDFVSYFEYEEDGKITEDLVIIPVEPDIDLMAEMLEREMKFWHHVQTRTPPNVFDFIPYQVQIIEDSGFYF